MWPCLVYEVVSRDVIRKNVESFGGGHGGDDDVGGKTSRKHIKEH